MISMATSSVTGSGISDALVRLDKDIAETERRLAELRAMRQNIQPFIETYLQVSYDADSGNATVSNTRASSLTDLVIQVFEEHPDQVLDVDDTLTFITEKGDNPSRAAVRNAINYVYRLEKIDRDNRRGHYFLRTTPTPAEAGVDAKGEPSDRLPQKELGDSP
jgi:hypothetical protein